MKIASKLAVALMLALIAFPQVGVTATYADDRDDYCRIPENQDEDVCKRERPKFHTKFFSEE
jgi:hypothetical protein